MTYNNYKIMLRPEPEGGFTVIVPSLPGCISYGSNLTEAKEMAKEAIELYLESLATHNEEIPNDNETFEYNILVESYA
ncbi:MAG: type II toxin-antitoxin system HicB family antitoxin [Bacteroidota bacterium]